jgi:hypothetical protein
MIGISSITRDSMGRLLGWRERHQYYDVVRDVLGKPLAVFVRGSSFNNGLVTFTYDVNGLCTDIHNSGFDSEMLGDLFREAGVKAGVTAEELAGGLLEGWDDLRFPAQGINPAGAVDAPAVDTDLNAFPGTLLFSGSAVNVIAGVAQMPHAWKRGTSLGPHIHWNKPVGSAAAVEWEYYYRHIGFAGDVAEAWVGPIAGVLAVGNQGTTNEHLITVFSAMDMAGKKESSTFCWQIRRQGTSDADNGVARLFEFDIHYRKSKQGTPNEIPD